jgi:hypothetical protein
MVVKLLVRLTQIIYDTKPHSYTNIIMKHRFYLDLLVCEITGGLKGKLITEHSVDVLFLRKPRTE